MGVVIESNFWEPDPSLYLVLFVACFSCIFFLPHSSSSSRSSTLVDAPPAAFLRFQRRFLYVYTLGSVVGGLHSVLGEFEYSNYGLNKEQMVTALSIGCATSLAAGAFLGIFSDLIGHKKACLLFCLLHLLVGLLKSITRHPSISLSNICLSVASSIFSVSFESWMVMEHDKLGHRQDLLLDTFWLMSYYQSAVLIGTQAVANLLVSQHARRGVTFPCSLAAVLAVLCFIYVSKRWNKDLPTSSLGSYKVAFSAHVLGDKRIWLLTCAQACFEFSLKIFWILWAPTVVADGREVHLSIIYPCLLGAQMLGSVAFPWFLNGPLRTPVEDLLTAAFCSASLAMFIVAYDYQEIAFLVALFCIFLACVGLILPSLGRMRTMLVPNELRAGMMSVSSAPANALRLLVLIQGGYNRNLSNAAIMAISAFVLLLAAICMHVLKRWTKHHHESHKL